MSFGSSNTVKAAQNNLGGISNTATANSGTELGLGTSALGTGQQTTANATNFFNTLLNGNAANTNALLQPNIQQIRNANQNSIQAASTLMPRGGARSSTLFQQPFQNNAQIGNLFTGMRSNAASGLGQIGLAQQGIGAGLVNTANQPLNTAAGAQSSVLQSGLTQEQINNSLFGGIGSLAGSLLTAPLGGGGGTLLGGIAGGLGNLFGGGLGYGSGLNNNPVTQGYI